MIERELDELLDALRVGYHKSPIDDGLNYQIAVRSGIDLQLDLDLYVDQAAYEWRLRRNPKAFDEWRAHCLSHLRNILTSDLRVETRWRWGCLLGGFLYRWDGMKWESCGGGSLFLFLGTHKVSEYRSWLA